MPKYQTLHEAYSECEINGLFRDRETDSKDKINTMLKISRAYSDSADKLKKQVGDNTYDVSVVYNLYYDSLRELAEALSLMNGKKIANHKCLFAYVCMNYDHLELSWDFFEKIRTKRNGISYYGTPVTARDLKEVELQIKLYIKVLREEIIGLLEKSE